MVNTSKIVENQQVINLSFAAMRSDVLGTAVVYHHIEKRD
jgi:hypothetical protein